MKNLKIGFGVFCILGALGQWMNIVGGEDVSIISIPVFLAVGIALIWFSKSEKQDRGTKGEIKNFSSETKQTEIKKTGRGYLCLDCDNSKLFQGTSELYRLYYKITSDEMDFDDEIVCPYEMRCEECSSKNIGIEIEKGKIIKNHRARGGNLCLIGSRKLVYFDSPDIETQLFYAMGGKEDWFNNERINFLNRLDDFDGDEEELFKSAKFVIVEIVSKGLIRQDEWGLGDEDSTYKSRRAARFY